MNAVRPSLKSAESKQAATAASTSARRRLSGSRSASRAAILAARTVSGALAPIMAAYSRTSGSSSVARRDAVDQADPQRLLGAELAGGEEDLLGDRRPDQVDQRLDAAEAVAEPEPRRRDGEAGALLADAQVAGQRHRQAAADAVAADHRDGRLGESPPWRRWRRPRPRVARLGGGVGPLGLELRDVGAGDEGASPAPVKTTTRTSGSASKAASTSGIARHMSSETALRRSGLLKIIQPIGPSLRPISFSTPRSIVSSASLAAATLTTAASLPSTAGP